MVDCCCAKAYVECLISDYFLTLSSPQDLPRRDCLLTTRAVSLVAPTIEAIVIVCCCMVDRLELEMYNCWGCFALRNFPTRRLMSGPDPQDELFGPIHQCDKSVLTLSARGATTSFGLCYYYREYIASNQVADLLITG